MRVFAGFAVGFLLLSGLGGCQSIERPFRLSSARPLERDEDEKAFFGPSHMRLNPIFTQIKDWNGDGNPDGIEAELEFQDQFEDPTKAAGKVIFELYYYREHNPEPRGERVNNPWIGSMVTLDEQKLRWNRTSRTYTFRLNTPGVSLYRSYVLEAMFEHTGGRRYFSRVIFKALPPEPKGVRPLLTPIDPTGLPGFTPGTDGGTTPATVPAPGVSPGTAPAAGRP